ncbi:hypothetical protein AAHU05_21640 [Klebsiella variicola subsp. variicola]|uniref:hypothetical protein n=1 Tax=Klebsiella variicola TaxID=244366 RepID=UPI00359F619C
MKLIGNLLCIGFIVWVVSFFVKAEKKEFPSSEVLVSQFEKMELFDKKDWKKGNVVDGVQVYTSHTADNILNSSWLLGVKQAAVISLSDIRDPAFEGVSALAVCFKLVKGVLGRDTKEDFKVVEDSFKSALSSGSIDNVHQDSQDLDGYKFEVQMKSVTSNINSYTCSIKEK